MTRAPRVDYAARDSAMIRYTDAGAIFNARAISDAHTPALWRASTSAVSYNGLDKSRFAAWVTLYRGEKRPRGGTPYCELADSTIGRPSSTLQKSVSGVYPSGTLIGPPSSGIFANGATSGPMRRERRVAVVPIYDGLRALLAEIPRRARTVLTTSRGPAVGSGFHNSGMTLSSVRASLGAACTSTTSGATPRRTSIVRGSQSARSPRSWASVSAR